MKNKSEHESEDKVFCIVIRSKETDQRLFVKDYKSDFYGKILTLELTNELSEAKRWILPAKDGFFNNSYCDALDVLTNNFPDWKIRNCQIHKKGKKPKRRYCIVAYMNNEKLFVIKKCMTNLIMRRGDQKIEFSNKLRDAFKTTSENPNEEIKAAMESLRCYFANLDFKACKLV